MKITLQHEASYQGVPTILDDDGAIMEPANGFRLALKTLGWDPVTAAKALYVKNRRSIYDWQEGKYLPPVRVLNLLMLELEKRGRNSKKSNE